MDHRPTGGSVGKESACSAGDLGSIPGLEDPLEKGMAAYSSILAWRIPWTEEPGGLQSTGSQELNTTERLTHHRHGARQVPHSHPCALAGSFVRQLPTLPPPNATPLGVRASTCGFEDTSGPQKAAKATTRPSTCCPRGQVTVSTDSRRAQSEGDFCVCWWVVEQLTLPATPPPTMAFLPLGKPHSPASADFPPSCRP